jgi:carbon storage regulator
MLVLTRKKQESLIIAGNISITVVSVENGRVRLGITAPHDVSVRRAELAPLPPRAEVGASEVAELQVAAAR